jgi:hypothetical protein
MTTEELQQLDDILSSKPFLVRPRLFEWRKALTVEEPPQNAPTGTTAPHSPRTDSQHRALFLWFGMIEKVCADQGVTADMVFRHTTQVSVTKEVLHHLCKTLIKALFDIDSTKDIEKLGHLDKVIDHFTILFGHEGVELPPFPSDESKNNVRLAQMENLNNSSYPEYTGGTAFDT